MKSFDWSRAAHVTCDKSSCHPLGNIVSPFRYFFCCRERYFLNQSYLALNFPGYKTGNVSTIKIVFQNKISKRFHVPDDTEIEELLEQKDAKNTKKVQRPPLNVSDIFLEESGRETNFENFEIAELDGTLRTFYAGARKEDGSLFKKSALQNIQKETLFS